MGSGHPLDIPPMTVPALFRRAVETFPHLPALADKRGGEWTRCFFAKKISFFVLTFFLPIARWTYEQYYEETRAAAKYLFSSKKVTNQGK